MNDSKLPHSLISMFLSWVLAGIAWCAAHLGLIATLFAVLASVYSAWASWETIKLRRKQQAQLTRGHYQEPESDI